MDLSRRDLAGPGLIRALHDAVGERSGSASQHRAARLRRRGPAEPPRPEAVRGVECWRALRSISENPNLHPDLSRLAQPLLLELGEHPKLLLAADDPADALQVFVDEAVASEFLTGRTHEAALFASGRLRVHGRFAEVTRALSGFSGLSRAYRRELGLVVGEPSRFDVLSAFPVDDWESSGIHDSLLIDGASIESQALLAAVLLVGLPGGCRRLEIPALWSAYESGAIAEDAMAAIETTLLVVARAAILGHEDKDAADARRESRSPPANLDVGGLERLAGLAAAARKFRLGGGPLAS